MKNGNVFVSVGMILVAAALLLESNQIIGETVFSILLGVAIGLGILNMLLPCIKKSKKKGASGGK